MTEPAVSTSPGRVSILVSTFNRAPYLRECLDSLLAQTRKPHEIIVVNDGSFDGTDAILDEYADRIIVIRQENSGKPRAINRAYERSSGEYLWIFDDDDVALPESIALHGALLDCRPELGFTYGNYLRGVDDSNGSIRVVGNAHVPEVAEDGFLISLLETCFLTTPSMLIRRSALGDAQIFDEGLMRSQDYELFLRLARSCRCEMIREPSFVRRYHSGPRGSLSDRFDVAIIEQKWFDYEKLATARFFREAGLEEFLPRSLIPHAHDPMMARRALAQKAVILARKGLWDDLARALHAIGDLRLRQSCVIQGSFLFFEKALRKDLAIRELLANEVIRARFERDLKSNLSRSEVNAWARGLWFALHDASCCLSESERRKATRMVFRLFGVAGLVGEVFRKLG